MTIPMNWKFLVFVTLLGAALAAAGDNSISITWSRNTEPDLLGYRLHFGTRPGAYTASRDVGDVATYTLTGLSTDTTYYIALTALDHWGNESGYSNEVEAAPEGGGGGGGNPAVPRRFELESAYPNPLRHGSAATLRFALPEAREEVTLAVYNTLGQRVRTISSGPAAAGYHLRTWDGRDQTGLPLAAGVYYIRFQTGVKILTTPITIFR